VTPAIVAAIAVRSGSFAAITSATDTSPTNVNSDRKTTRSSAVGDVLGLTVGKVLGLVVGVKVASVGLVVGIVVGLALGEVLGLALGNVDGDELGDAVGPSVGDDEGSSDGDSDGDAVGTLTRQTFAMLGDVDGLSEGLALGLVVGTRDGDAVGDGEGGRVGSNVGLDVGVSEGAVVGLLDGAKLGAVGAAVGTAVGAAHRWHALQLGPPQSTSLSCPLRTPSTHEAPVGLKVGALVGDHVGARDGIGDGAALGVTHNVLASGTWNVSPTTDLSTGSTSAMNVAPRASRQPESHTAGRRFGFASSATKSLVASITQKASPSLFFRHTRFSTATSASQTPGVSRIAFAVSGSFAGSRTDAMAPGHPRFEHSASTTPVFCRNACNRSASSSVKRFA